MLLNSGSLKIVFVLHATDHVQAQQLNFKLQLPSLSSIIWCLAICNGSWKRPVSLYWSNTCKQIFAFIVCTSSFHLKFWKKPVVLQILVLHLGSTNRTFIIEMPLFKAVQTLVIQYQKIDYTLVYHYCCWEFEMKVLTYLHCYMIWFIMSLLALYLFSMKRLFVAWDKYPCLR